jgi:pyrroline-5-carboxylate reductase
MLSDTIGFIGAGQMARALAGGFVRAGLVAADHCIASDAIPDALVQFTTAVPGATAARDNKQVLGDSNVVFLSVKPQTMPAVLAELQGQWTDNHLVVSIAAGVTLATLEKGLGPAGRLVRVMPNTPCLVGQSASAFALGRGATADDAALVERLLTAVGRSYRVDEKLLDAVTGLSGSGPAYVYLVIEALSDGGVLMGLPRDIATALAAQTVLGSAAMVLSTGEHPRVLADRVTSPGGTTIAGLKALEGGGLRSTLIQAVEAATRRATELGKS